MLIWTSNTNKKYFGCQQKIEKNGSAHLRKDDQSNNGLGTLRAHINFVAPEEVKT